MDSGVKAGVVIVQKFCSSKSNVFSSYIDYINREEAVRLGHENEFDMFANYVGDYMDNHEKTTGIFTNGKEELSKEEKDVLKKGFQKAQEKDSLMWQTVISFDNRWLEEMGLLKENVLDQIKIQEYVRNAMGRMAKEEQLDQALWAGCIHYNTDNIHVHVAMVETSPTREKMIYKGQEVYRGKFKQKSIEACKSSVVNQIIQERGYHEDINRLIREQILFNKKKKPLVEDPELCKRFLNLYEKLPENKSICNYGNPGMIHLREELDELSNEYLNKYHREDFKKLKKLIQQQDRMYQVAYGESKQGYGERKIEDLYKRLGNTILKEMKEYDKRMKSATYGTVKKSARDEHGSVRTKVVSFYLDRQTQRRANYELEKSIGYLKRSMREDYETWKNIQEYDYEFEQIYERE